MSRTMLSTAISLNPCQSPCGPRDYDVEVTRYALRYMNIDGKPVDDEGTFASRKASTRRWFKGDEVNCLGAIIVTAPRRT